jgi:hypothetical protein
VYSYDELGGSLGQATWDEYDPQLDWERFDVCASLWPQGGHLFNLVSQDADFDHAPYLERFTL